MGTAQSSLFTDHLSDNRLVVETKLRNLGRNRVAFGITKTSLKKGSYGVLENIFYGMYNIEIPLEILSIENPAEILSNYFAAGSLKRENVPPNPNIPHDFLSLVNYINEHSYKNIKFASLAHKFKKSSCFDSRPGEQRKRLEFLEQSVMDGFVNSFLAEYRSSDKENSFSYFFHDPNREGESKVIYADIIYEKLKSLSEKAKQI